MFRTSLTTSVLLFLAAQASAQFHFDPAVSLPVGNQPDQSAVGDFNGDGVDDLATTSDAPDKIQVLFGNGDGTFAAPVSVNLTGSSSPTAIGADDVDCDGDVDLLVVLRDLQTLQVVENLGTGTFAPGGQFAVGDRGIDLALGDLNGDGLPDAVVSNRDDFTVSVLLNQGSRTFSSSSVALGAELRELTMADLDEDGDRDVAVSVHDARTVVILDNDGTGALAVGTTLSVGGNVRPDGIDHADLDADGDEDLAVATSGNGLNQVTVFLQTAPGVFSGAMSYPVGGTNPGTLVAQDLDLDGDVDVATANQDSGNVSLVPNLGAGAFGMATVMAVGTNPGHLVCADVHGDRAMDLVATNRDSNSLSLIANQLTGPWTDLGSSLAGTLGRPHLQGTGSLANGSFFDLDVTRARPGARLLMVIGVDTLNAPLFGGVLVPTPDLLIALPANACGELSVTARWPRMTPAGTSLVFQAWILDPAGPAGFAATNGLQGTQP